MIQLDPKLKRHCKNCSNQMNSFVFDTQKKHTGVILVSDNVFRFGSCQSHCIIPSHDYFSNLSDEIVLKIFNKLPKHDLLNISTVCKRWYRLSYVLFVLLPKLFNWYTEQFQVMFSKTEKIEHCGSISTFRIGLYMLMF
jgi:hypothetical protein